MAGEQEQLEQDRVGDRVAARDLKGAEQLGRGDAVYDLGGDRRLQMLAELDADGAAREAGGRTTRTPTRR